MNKINHLNLVNPVILSKKPASPQRRSNQQDSSSPHQRPQPATLLQKRCSSHRAFAYPRRAPIEFPAASLQSPDTPMRVVATRALAVATHSASTNLLDNNQARVCTPTH